MGKAQSKRSVDITTDPKKDGIVEEGTGELKKIEDTDQLKVNGDTHHNETEEKKELAEAVETENEKDLSTEKEQQKTNDGACGDVGAASEANEVTVGDKSSTDAEETLNDSKSADTAENSSKKVKKEKVKKKWSFRNISFGKKDKQKPTKREEAANTSAVNGECEKVPEEVTEEQAPATIEKKEEAVVITAEPEQLSEEVKSQPAEKIEEEPKTDVAEESTTNGAVVEENKEENASPSSPVIEKCEEPVSVPDVPPVADNTSEAVVTNGDKHVEENGTSAIPTMNGSTESPKTEVKEELLVEQEHINNTTTAIIVDNIEQINITEEKTKETTTVPITTTTTTTTTTDGDSEIKLPPPPLPCSLPPSQVMVFALSESASNEQKDDKSPSNLIPTDIPSSASSDTSQVGENIVGLETITKDNEGIEAQNVEQITTEDNNQSNAILTRVEEKNLEKAVEELEKSVEVEKELISESENNDVHIKSESDDINSKVDENKVLNEQNDIVEINALESGDKKINEIVLNDIIVEEKKSDESAIFENQISEKVLTNENNKERTDDKSIKNDCVEIETLKENINQIHSDINDDLPPPPPTPPELKLSMQDIQNGNKNDDIVDAITEKLNDVNLNSNENIILAATQEQQHQQQHNKKENGVGEIHEQNEVPATENLNGGEHKTIEEIKAENQQIEKAATEITQETAVTAE